MYIQKGNNIVCYSSVHKKAQNSNSAIVRLVEKMKHAVSDGGSGTLS